MSVVARTLPVCNATPNRMRNPMKPFPKIDPLPGSIHMEFRRCGKPNCRCAGGRLHGPYYVRRWQVGGRQRKAYVPRDRVVAALLAVAARKALLPPAAEMARITK